MVAFCSVFIIRRNWRRMKRSMKIKLKKENRPKSWSFQDSRISEKKNQADTSETPWCVPQSPKCFFYSFNIQVLFAKVQTKGKYFFYIFAHLLGTHIRCAQIHLLHAAIANKRQTVQKGANEKGFNAWQIQQHQEFLNLLFSYFLGAHGQLLPRLILFCENRNWICIFK